MAAGGYSLLARVAFLLEGKPVMLVRPGRGSGIRRVGSGRCRPDLASAGRQVDRVDRSPHHGSQAKVARASRIYVEGRHDAELVERIWGDDLRDVGVVVEYLGGI